MKLSRAILEITSSFQPTIVGDDKQKITNIVEKSKKDKTDKFCLNFGDGGTNIYNIKCSNVLMCCTNIYLPKTSLIILLSPVQIEKIMDNN